MYLHLGQNAVVPEDTVVGIFDMDNATSSYLTRETLNRAEKAGAIVNVGEDLPKSFVVCKDGEKTRIYLSQLNSATLLKRCENLQYGISGFTGEN